MSVIHELSPVGIARRRLAEATTACEAALADLTPLLDQRDTAQARLEALEALPVDLQHVDTARELEIASLRRGLVQLAVRIDAAKRTHRQMSIERNDVAQQSNAVISRLAAVETMLHKLSDLTDKDVELMSIRDHARMVGAHTRELIQLTSAPATSSAPA